MTPEQLSKEADRCVKCGLCLPHCPTYRLTRDEGDSPRGRIALIQALIGHSLDSPRLTRHLERCLGCRRCEAVCPSGVHYGEIIDGVRTLERLQGGPGRRLLLDLLSRLPYWRGSLPGLRLYQQSGVRRLIRHLAGLRRLDDMLPALAPGALPALAGGEGPEPAGESGRRVALFTGCVGRISDQAAIRATLRVLHRLGVSVTVPPDQGCCGAMHRHNGHPARAQALARANSEVFDRIEAEAILFLASGCGAQLADYGQTGTPLAVPPMEICHYLVSSGLAASLQLASSDRKVLVHTPCSLRYPLGGGDWVFRLLGQIPGIDLQPLQDTGCCGAAGTYLLTQPEMADALREPTLAAADDARPQILVTSNSGCALHLRAGLKQRGAAVEVLHPIELIERQMSASNQSI